MPFDPTSKQHALASKVSFWLRASRFQFFTASVVPVIVGGATAYWETGTVLWSYWIATLVALVLLHAAANLANDYYDHLSRNDEINIEFISPFTGGSRFIQKQLTSPVSILIAALACLAVGSGIGLILVWLRGWPILVLGVVGGLSGFFYTANPLRLGYRGLGEIFIFLDFGILSSSLSNRSGTVDQSVPRLSSRPGCGQRPLGGTPGATTGLLCVCRGLAGGSVVCAGVCHPRLATAADTDSAVAAAAGHQCYAHRFPPLRPA